MGTERHAFPSGLLVFFFFNGKAETVQLGGIGFYTSITVIKGGDIYQYFPGAGEGFGKHALYEELTRGWFFFLGGGFPPKKHPDR